MKVYIAHPMPTRHRIRDTICPAIQSLGIHTLNPFYNEDGTHREDRPEIKAIDDGTMGEYGVKNIQLAEEIVNRDLEKIRSSDGLVAMLDEEGVIGIGTPMEIFYCARWCKKPVFIVTSKYYGHPWLNYLASLSNGAVVGSVEELFSRLQLWKKREGLYEERKDT
jgi:nucleoside 2-deoxyribosyltransferase